MIINSTFDADADNWKPSSSDKRQWDSAKPEMDGGSIKFIYSGTSDLNLDPFKSKIVVRIQS